MLMFSLFVVCPDFLGSGWLNQATVSGLNCVPVDEGSALVHIFLPFKDATPLFWTALMARPFGLDLLSVR